VIQSRRLWIAVLMSCAVAGTVSAASFIVPSDRELVRSAKAIVIATAQSSYVVPGEGDMINTVYVMRVDEVIKGAVSVGRMEIVEPGGFIGGRGVIVPGVPSYAAGERALIFLEPRSGSDLRTASMGIGKFNFVRDLQGTRLLMRGQDDEAIFGWDAAGNPYHDVIRSEEKFLQFVRAEACGEPGNAAYAVDPATVALARKVKPSANGGGFRACDYATNLSGPCGCPACGGKWKDIFDQPGGGGSVSYSLVGSQSGGVNGPSGVSTAMGAWNGNSQSNVNLVTGGGSSSIRFDDTAGVTSICGGSAVGCASVSYAGSLFTFDTGQFVPIASSTVFFRAAFTGNQTFFDQVAAHELGHTIGFRHSNEGTPSAGTAIMMAVANASFPLGPNLQSWDNDAVATMYNPAPTGGGGGGPTCTVPSGALISGGPASITAGASVNFTVDSANGTAPFAFQWFTGNPGTGAPISGATGNSTTQFPTATTTYHVRVTNACGSTFSNAITVTVQQATCIPTTQVSISGGPTSVIPGATVNFAASANGTNPSATFTWFTGNPPSGTQINGATGATLQANPTVTTSYYAQARNTCSTGPVTSNVITVNVQPCTAPTSASALAAPTTIIAGGSTNLSVSSDGTGPFTIQWFQGNPPGAPIPTAANLSSFSANPTGTTMYYAEVSNACGGPARSNVVTVTVAAQCTPPSNAVATADKLAITSGQTANLSVAANGTGLAFQWFTGAPPSGTEIVGATSAALPVTPAATTTYYARITGTCGTPINSNAITITVSAACTLPSVATQPANQTIVVGTKATLSVVAAGTGLTYQWFEGATGDTSKPQNGATSASFTTPALLKKTQYWVRVSGTCTGAQPVFSHTATVEVKGPRGGRPAKH
jgi:Ig-like domain CHU_C associated